MRPKGRLPGPSPCLPEAPVPDLEPSTGRKSLNALHLLLRARVGWVSARVTEGSEIHEHCEPPLKRHFFGLAPGTNLGKPCPSGTCAVAGVVRGASGPPWLKNRTYLSIVAPCPVCRAWNRSPMLQRRPRHSNSSPMDLWGPARSRGRTSSPGRGGRRKPTALMVRRRGPGPHPCPYRSRTSPDLFKVQRTSRPSR